MACNKFGPFSSTSLRTILLAKLLIFPLSVDDGDGKRTNIVEYRFFLILFFFFVRIIVSRESIRVDKS